jgi:hypothetical protein
MGCNDSKYTCGIIVPATCSPFQKKLSFVEPADQLKCDSSVYDALLVFDKYMKKLVDGNNLTTLDYDCFEDINPLTITPAQLHQKEMTDICLLKGQVEALTEQLNDLNIGNEVIEVTLPECLQADIAPCAVGPNSYQLINLIVLFANKLCDLETRISNLES